MNICCALMTYSSFSPIQDIHEKLQFGRVVCQMHHVGLKKGNITIIIFVERVAEMDTL